MNTAVENQSARQAPSLTAAFKTRLRVYAWLLLTLITLVVAATAIADIIILWVGPGTQLPR